MFVFFSKKDQDKEKEKAKDRYQDGDTEKADWWAKYSEGFFFLDINFIVN